MKGSTSNKVLLITVRILLLNENYNSHTNNNSIVACS
jgi:hypothetical protein